MSVLQEGLALGIFAQSPDGSGHSTVQLLHGVIDLEILVLLLMEPIRCVREGPHHMEQKENAMKHHATVPA